MNEQQALGLGFFSAARDGMKGEVIVRDGSGVRIHWEDGQLGYYQFTNLLSQIEKGSALAMGIETPRNQRGFQFF